MSETLAGMLRLLRCCCLEVGACCIVDGVDPDPAEGYHVGGEVAEIEVVEEGDPSLPRLVYPLPP